MLGKQHLWRKPTQECSAGQARQKLLREGGKVTRRVRWGCLYRHEKGFTQGGWKGDTNCAVGLTLQAKTLQAATLGLGTTTAGRERRCTAAAGVATIMATAGAGMATAGQPTIRIRTVRRLLPSSQTQARARLPLMLRTRCMAGAWGPSLLRVAAPAVMRAEVATHLPFLPPMGLCFVAAVV